MNDDAVQRLREPAAWVLLGAVLLQFLAGLITLFFTGGGQSETAGGITEKIGVVPFKVRAYNELTGTQFFTSVAIVGLVVLAVLLVTRLGAQTSQARLVVMVGLGLLAAIAVFGLVVTLTSLAVPGMATKMSGFLFGVAKLAVVGVGGFYAFTVFQKLSPSPQQGMQAAGYYGGQPQGAYPQAGYAQAQAPAYGQAQAPAPAYGQQQQVYGQQQAYQQPGYGQQQPPAYGQQPAQQPGYGQYAPQQPAPQQPQQPGSYGAQPYEAPQQPEADAGQWTHAYGASSEEQAEPEAPQAEGEPGQWTRAYGSTGEEQAQPAPGSEHQDWYREEPGNK